MKNNELRKELQQEMEFHQRKVEFIKNLLDKIPKDEPSQKEQDNETKTLLPHPMPNFGDNTTVEFVQTDLLKQFGSKRVVNEKPKKGLAVDVGTKGNPGLCEYRGIDIETKKLIFHFVIPGISTNNIGEFLAVIEGLKHVYFSGIKFDPDYYVWSDSQTALSWCRKRQCKTNFFVTDDRQKVMIKEAERFLKQHPTIAAKFWTTPIWGQIPADFGRK